MNFVEIKLNITKGDKDTRHTVNSLDKLDDVLSDIVPKMFYYFKTTEEGIFVAVQEEFGDRIREVLSKTLFIDLIGFKNMSMEYLK